MFHTFRIDAATSIDLLSIFTLYPEFSLSFRILHESILADF